MALMLSPTLPKSANAYDDLAARADIDATITSGGPERHAAVQDKFGNHRLNIVADLYDSEHATIRLFEKIREMLGDEYCIHIADRRIDNPDDPTRRCAPIELRLYIATERSDLEFNAYPHEPYDDDRWSENENGCLWPEKTLWREEQYGLYAPSHWLFASTWVTNEADRLLALEYSIRRSLLIAPLVNELGAIESLIAVERALMTAHFGWKTTRYTWI